MIAAFVLDGSCLTGVQKSSMVLAMRKKVEISLDKSLLADLDRAVKAGVFDSRSDAIRIALAEMIERQQRRRLARECAKLDRREEQRLAELGMAHSSSTRISY